MFTYTNIAGLFWESFLNHHHRSLESQYTPAHEAAQHRHQDAPQAAHLLTLILTDVAQFFQAPRTHLQDLTAASILRASHPCHPAP